MRKNIIFDLDGVLIDAAGLHRDAFIASVRLSGVPFTEEDHATLESLCTRQKLNRLIAAGVLSDDQADDVEIEKRRITRERLATVEISPSHCEMIRRLTAEGYTVQICSNCISDTIQTLKDRHGLDVAYCWGSDSVESPKPNPEMFLRAMTEFGFGPDDTLIVEDSLQGLQAAVLSRAKILSVSGPHEVNYEVVTTAANDRTTFPSPLTNILVPMAGSGERFRNAGYEQWKPLIDVKGQFMLSLAVKSLGVGGRYIFVSRTEDARKYSLRCITNLIAPGSSLVTTDGPTEGAVSTTLLAESLIDDDRELMIVNCDQCIRWDAKGFFDYAREGRFDGVSLTFRDADPKWSFCRMEGERVVEVAEKKPISDRANVGIYWWRRGRDYVACAKGMIRDDRRVNGEFYVAPVYNEAITRGLKIGAFDVHEMNGLGTPADLNTYLAKP